MTTSCHVIQKLEQALAGELHNDIIVGSLAEGVLTVLEGLGWDHAHHQQCCNADIYSDCPLSLHNGNTEVNSLHVLDVAWLLPKGN
ncbi:hypothetical protein BDN71DRAFT_1442605 [Pleurotus eryngii]|uniref:Uncharacterized protein n=1 Tax=Pleurotus eryngii TaxID=5323 RepID=A0A9P6A6F1_PLEER|nr:hypothetical protein BDN71DRAFT_1442605 [Pleurotus eryngii]